jgi:DNA-binding NarL/FixJ family response regulator
MKVFLVEDSQAVRERIRGMLACIPDIELVAEADNEDDAMQGICTVLPDVVILDLTLAGGSGISVLRRIRLQPLTVRVVVLTNSAAPAYREKCIELGADYFLDKTHEIPQLETLLTKLAGLFRRDL